MMAQSTNVYSLNAVGYINVTCPPGFSIVANQLNTTNNTIFGLLPVDPGGADDGTSVYEWNGHGFAVTTMNSSQAGNALWSPPSIATATTMNPGEAVFILNEATEADGVTPTNYVATFVGQVPQGTFTNALNPGSEVYGSLGAGIALLFWLYIISLSVLCGAEFNAQLYAASPHVARPAAEMCEITASARPSAPVQPR